MSLPKTFYPPFPHATQQSPLAPPKHNLEDKLKAIATAGFQGIELGFPGLLYFASKNLGREVGPQDFDVRCNAGLEVKRMCKELGLEIVMLQPSANFERWKP